MMQKDSVVKSQSIYQQHKKGMQRKNTITKKDQNNDRTMVCHFKPQTQHNKKKERTNNYLNHKY